MKFVLKREYFNYYIDNFLNNLCSHSFTNSLASLELNREPLILALNPFLSSYLEGLISQSISSLSYDRSYYVKYENVSNQHYIQFKENDDQMKEDIDNLISYLSTQSQMLLSYNQDTVIDAEVDGNMLMLGDKYYSMDHFISVDSDVLDVKIFTDKSACYSYKSPHEKYKIC